VSEDKKIDTNAWMVTFADLVMLLLTFFVMLLTMSSMDAKKLESLFTHFNEASGVLEFSGTMEVANFGAFVSKYNDTASLLVIDQNKFISSLNLPESLGKMIKDLDHKLLMTDDERGLILSFDENLLFDPGETTIKKELWPVLDMIADAISECDNEILVMGHADSSPLANGRYNTNWELSAYRGLSVLDYFLQQKKLSSARFSVGGYGASRPLYPNDTLEHKAANRRVEIIFKHL